MKNIAFQTENCGSAYRIVGKNEGLQMKIVVTIVGKDSVGIIAAVSTLLAENDVNILSINQNIMDGFFNMVMIADMAGSKIELAAVRQLLQEKGEALGVEIKTQHEDIFNAMHKV